MEPPLRSHPDADRVSFQGLPDIRVICAGDQPHLAMLRLPTSASVNGPTPVDARPGLQIQDVTGRGLLDEAMLGSAA